jgi:DNA repair protein RadD
VFDPWPHQLYAEEQVLAAFARGERRVLLTIPTGGGKTLVTAMLIRRWLEDGLKVVVYTNRRAMLDQLSRVLGGFGFDHGIRAKGHGSEPGRDLQIASIQTEYMRAIKKQSWGLFDADRYVIDEAHLNKEPQAQAIADAHDQEGAYGLGLTATPVDLGHMYQCLIQAGSMTELRACGALVPFVHYGPDEPDLSDIKPKLGEDLTEQQNIHAMMRGEIFGRVGKWYKILNPDQRPTILFAPGRRESLWFAEQFTKVGLPAAHVAHDEIWVAGDIMPNTTENRDEVFEASRTGKIKVICNRFMLREGIDAPWLTHGIFATVFGSLQTYLQSGGRLGRSCPGKTQATIQDHGGNWLRHGSLNADREWNHNFTGLMVSGLREARIRKKRCQRCDAWLTPFSPACPKCAHVNEIEPVRCPNCAKIVQGGRCGCGWVTPGKRSRAVVTSDGTLKQYHGDYYQPRRVSQKPNGKALWIKCYYRAKNSKNRMTFRQAFAMFASENEWGWPDPTWPLMPTDELDEYLAVADVAADRLVERERKEVEPP